MEPRLMKESHDDYTRMMRERYARRRGKEARGLLLDEYCRSTGLERKYANKVLRGQRRRGRSESADPPSREIYTEADIAVLKGVWMSAGQPCGKRLAGEALELWLKSWERRHGELGGEERERLAGISAAQIDRELAPHRSGGRKRRIASSALAAMQREIAVRCEPWSETAPGALEIDTVALCGGSMGGAIVWALDATDIHSGWTEVRAVWNRGGHATKERMAEIGEALPFGLRKLDFDNGLEFLNAHFVGHFRAHEPKVEMSRSRPYRKNDNAHIEQKNYTHVRLLLGDDRFERMELVEPLNEVLREWSLWNNLYGAQRRLLRKERQADGKVRRHHEKRAATPCARLLVREDLREAHRGKLEALLATHDPIEMRESIERKLSALYALRAKLAQDGMDRGTDAPAEPGPKERKANRRPAGKPRAPACARAAAPVACSPTARGASCEAARAPGTAKESLRNGHRTRRKGTATVSVAVRHRAAS